MVDALNVRSRARRGTALFDNVRSAFNVGSMLRTADGVGLAHVHLCGTTAPATSPKVAKTALGAEASVPSSHHRNALQRAGELIATGHRLWALEVGGAAVSVFDSPTLGEHDVLVVGNELAGIDPEVVKLCEGTVSIPMYGAKGSFNVAVAFGIAAAVLTRELGENGAHRRVG